MINPESLTGTSISEISVELRGKKTQQLCGRVREGNHCLDPAEPQRQLFETPGKRNGIYFLGLQKQVQILHMFCKKIGQN